MLHRKDWLDVAGYMLDWKLRERAADETLRGMEAHVAWMCQARADGDVDALDAASIANEGIELIRADCHAFVARTILMLGSLRTAAATEPTNRQRAEGAIPSGETDDSYAEQG